MEPINMDQLFKKALSLGVGITITGKEKVEQYVEEMVKKGEVAPGESRELVARLMQKGEEERLALKSIIRDQIQQLLIEMNMATKGDIQRIEERIARLEATNP
jgi:polyhydroxyalkanoate synthesis regulator phasin